MVVTLGMGFTGYLLPYTQLAYNATNVGVVLALRLPTFGPLLGPFVLGDGTSQGLLGRMFDAHVILLPLALAGLFYAHLALFESHGIAPPATSDPVQRRRFTDKEEKDHVPFIPHIFFYTLKWGLLYLGILFGIAALWPWNLPTYVGNTAAAAVVTEPDWYFLWLFKLVDFQGVTPVIAIGASTAILLYILFLPFLDRSKRTHPRDRGVHLSRDVPPRVLHPDDRLGRGDPGGPDHLPEHRGDDRPRLRGDRGGRRSFPLAVSEQLPTPARGAPIHVPRFVPDRTRSLGRSPPELLRLGGELL